MKKLVCLILVVFICASCVFADEDKENIRNLEVLLLNGRYDDVIYGANRFLQKRDSKKDVVHFLMGMAYLKKESYEDARLHFEILRSDYKKSEYSDDALLAIADTFRLQRQYEKASALYGDFINSYQKSPLLHMAYYSMGCCYIMDGRLDKAKEYFDFLKKEWPDSFETDSLSQFFKDSQLYFTVQVGSFRVKENAYKLRDSLSSKGYQADISQIQKDNLVYHRVVVGRFDTRAQAQELKEELERQGFAARIFP